MRTLQQAALVGLLLLACTPLSAAGMTVVQRDFPELVARAEQIVVGTVTAIREAEEDGVPSTFVTFSDLSVLKGDVGAELTLRFYGGGTGRYVIQLPDMPHFSLGERAVVFVAGNGRDVCPLVGIWQGRFRVRSAEADAAESIENHDGKPIVGLAGRELQIAPADSAGDGGGAAVPMTLDTFRQLIADEIAAPQGTAGVSR